MTLKPPNGVTDTILTWGDLEDQLDTIALVASPENYPGLDPTGVTDSTATLQDFFNDVAAHGRGLIPNGIYKFTNLTVPSTEGDEGGCIIEGVSRKRTTLICTATTGFGITFGDGAGFTTVAQEIRNLTIAGNANCDGAIEYLGARDCAIRKAYIHGFTNASAVGVLYEAAHHNYFNEIESCWFGNSRAHVRLNGSGGIGGNSNYIFHNHFETPSSGGSYAIIVDGGATNRITENEFGSTMAVGVRFENNANAINNQVSQNQFDGPTKAWEIAGSSVVDTDLLWNSGAAAILASTNSGTRTTHRDRLTEQANAQVNNSVAQSVGGLQTLTWDTAQYDPSGMHSASDRFTIAVAGKYRFSVNISFDANATAERGVRVCKNGTATILGEISAVAVTAGSYTQLSLCEVTTLEVGDYIIARSYQTTGGGLDVLGGLSPGSRFSIERIA